MQRNNPFHSYDLIIIGLGLVGSSALYEAAKILKSRTGNTLFGKSKILGIEQYPGLHPYGSSHGESRMTRLAIGEGEDYVSLAKKSQNRLRDLRANTKAKFGPIFYDNNTGMLILGPASEDSLFHGKKGFLQTTQKIAYQDGIPHKNYHSNEELNQDFPQFILNKSTGGYLENSIGIFDPEACIQAQLYLAKQEKAEVHYNEEVKSFEQMPDGKLLVKTNKDEYMTTNLLISAGPWMSNFLNEEIKKELTVYRETVFYFEIEEAYKSDFMIGKFHPFVWDLGRNKCVWGVPIIDNGKTAIKIGTISNDRPTTPSTVDRTVSDDEIVELYNNFIKPYFVGVSPRCIKSYACLCTKTKDSNFLIDYLPNFNNVLFASACSGHGAKHAPAVGEALAQQVLLGYSDENILKFNMLARKEKTNRISNRQG